jgi:hypothetical protein
VEDDAVNRELVQPSANLGRVFDEQLVRVPIPIGYCEHLRCAHYDAFHQPVPKIYFSYTGTFTTAVISGGNHDPHR